MIMDQAWQQFLKLQEFWLQLLVIELVKLKNETIILKKNDVWFDSEATLPTIMNIDKIINS